MANPVRQLLDRIAQLQRNGGQTGVDARGLGQATVEGAGAVLLEDARLLARVNDCIDRLADTGLDVGAYRAALHRWTLGIFSYPNGWKDMAIENLYPGYDLDFLSLLADQVDRVLVYRPDEEGLGLIRGLLDDVEQLLREDDAIASELRYYIHTLVSQIRQAVADQEVLDDFDLKDALGRLWVAFYGASAQSTKWSERWQSFAQKLLWPATAGLLGNLPGLTVSAIQLTTGSS